jgi:hypothetical protein
VVAPASAIFSALCSRQVKGRSAAHRRLCYARNTILVSFAQACCDFGFVPPAALQIDENLHPIPFDHRHTLTTSAT